MTTTEIAKENWVAEYADRILEMWRKRQGPLGRVSEQYIEKLREDLAEDFDDPLKRELIETTYLTHHPLPRRNNS